MTAALLWIARFFILYCIIKIIRSLLGSSPKKPGPHKTPKEAIRRFAAKGKKVEEGDFKDL
jgi:hypothetical protein